MKNNPVSMDGVPTQAAKPRRAASQRSARWTYDSESDLPVHLVPELVMLGSDELRKATALHEHEHPGCFEFVFIERGKASWELEGIVYETRAGELFHTRPGEKHSGGFNVIEPCKFWWVILTAPHRERWLQLLPEEIQLVEQAFSTLPRIVGIGITPADSFKKLQEAINKKSMAQSVAVRHALQELVLAFIEPCGDARPVADDLLLRFDGLIGHMRNRPEWRPTVEELAVFAGISSSHFYRTFQDYTGEPPMTFIERLRIKGACRQLAESDETITDIAFQLGYQTSQHFATVFKRFVGVTPTEWRKNYFKNPK